MIIRWTRIVPRLLILALLVGVAWLGQNELIRWQLKSNIESQSGAGAEVGNVRAEWGQGKVSVADVRLFDPKDSRRELLHADKIVVRGAYKDILRRYFHLPQVDVEGIRIALEENDSGELVPDRLWRRFKDRIPKELESLEGLDWISLLAGDPESVAKDLLKQLETTRLVNEMQGRWTAEIEQFETLGKALKSRFQNVQNFSDRARNTPDRLLVAQEFLKEIEAADLGIQQILTLVAQLKTKAQSDYQQLLETSQRDRAVVQNWKVPQVDTSQLSEMLVGPEIREQWEKSVAWSDWALSLLTPVETEDGSETLYERFGFEPPRPFRGETILPALLDARPDLLVDTTNLTGQILFGTTPIYFNGTIGDAAYPLALGPAPVVARFCFSGSGIPGSSYMPGEHALVAEQFPATIDTSIFPNLYVMLQVDRLGENENDLMKFSCPMYRLPERVLGKPDKFAIAVSPGVTRLDGVLNLQGERISGQMRLSQSQIRMAAILPPKHQNTPIHRFLQETLDSMTGFVAEVLVTGNRNEPKYAFSNNIAETLRPRIENLLQSEWNAIRQNAEKSLSDEANRGVATLNAAIQEKLDPLVNDMSSRKSQWETQLAQSTGIPLDQLLQAQYNNLSPKDQQKVNQLMANPAVQSLFQQGGTPGTEKIQQGVEKLQDKLPGAIDRLFKK